MNIGGALKLLEILDPKENSKLLGKISAEAKATGDMKSIFAQLAGSMSGMENILSGIAADMNKMHGAMKTKPKASKEDVEAAKKTLAKLMKSWQANRVKMLEQQIGVMEKNLAALRKELAAAKGSKPEGWFM